MPMGIWRQWLKDSCEMPRPRLGLLNRGPSMPTIMLSAHFSLAEMTASQEAARAGIPNNPPQVELINLTKTAQTMEQVRALLGDFPITVTSGYRAPEVNRRVGGATNSAHILGLACDFIVPGFGDPETVCKALEPHMVALHIDQLIWEFNSWTHLGLSTGAPRNQALTIDSNGTRVGFG